MDIGLLKGHLKRRITYKGIFTAYGRTKVKNFKMRRYLSVFLLRVKKQESNHFKSHP